MNIPQINTYEHQAIDAVAFVLNRAQDKLGIHRTLGQIAETYVDLAPPVKLSVDSIVQPIAQTGKKFIETAINKHWRLTELLMYTIRFQNCSENETSKFYYYEVIFSQPTNSYPIPQTTASVFFRIEDKQLEHPRAPERPGPKVTFRIEGQHQDHDVRYVNLTAEWILAVMQMKIKLFKRIESYTMF